MDGETMDPSVQQQNSAGGDSASSGSSSHGQHGSQSLENIKVAIRLRPFTEKEKQKGSRRIVDIEQNTAVLYCPKYGDTSLKKFTFDHSYWSHDGFTRDSDGVNMPDSNHPNGIKYVGQEKVFEDLGQFLLRNALEGYNSALLAYGQTGSGKSYTITGYGQNEGIVPRFARALFEELDKKARLLDAEAMSVAQTSAPSENNSTETVSAAIDEGETELSRNEQAEKFNQNRYEVYFSMLEIYNEVARDLLAKNHGHLVTQSTFARRGLKVREHPKHGFFVENLTSYACADKTEIERRIEEGQLNKSIAATSMNETSSRGHTIYEFKIKQYKLLGSGADESREETLTTSVVQLVDLAGSERMAVHVTGQLGGDSFIASRASSPYPRADKGSGSSRSSSRSKGASERLPSTKSSRRRGVESGGGGPNGSLYGDNSHQQRFKESVSINQSLSALGNCIQVLSQYSQQMEQSSGSGGNRGTRAPPKIPYRDSMLTKLLNRCCLNGNSKVVIIATLSPAEANYDDTLSTLRFADRAKQIRTHATINLMSRSEAVDNLQKENERLKQIVDGRVTRSDDSSQTSNFDDSENVMENFAGSKIRETGLRISGSGQQHGGADTTSTPVRSRTTVRKSRNDRFHHEARAKSHRSMVPRLAASTSNPSLQIKEQMKRLVSPASRKMLNTMDGSALVKSKSMAQSLSTGGPNSEVGMALDEGDANFEMDLNDLDDIKEGIISPESDADSASALEDMSVEEKIGMFNKMLSNSMSIRAAPMSPTRESDAAKKTSRPKRGAARGSGIKHTQVSLLSSSLKKSNPYISNLNQDEQLTGVISYIIKPGETIVGKSGSCDIVLHGTELRSRHAKLTRMQNRDDGTEAVYIEPLLHGEDDGDGNGGGDDPGNDVRKNVALMVNGSAVLEPTELRHGNRLLFGTNSYFVYVDNKVSDASIALNSITYHMAQNEVLKKVMSEEKNEAMIKEINGYTHRPGTGKAHKSIKRQVTNNEGQDQEPGRPVSEQTSVSTRGARELGSAAHDSKEASDASVIPGAKDAETIEHDSEEVESQEAKFKSQLMEDTYEYAMPVAEVNAVANEMGVKVTYGLKILTGEEQLADQLVAAGTSIIDSNNSDEMSSSSLGEDLNSSSNNTRTGNTALSDRVTHISRLDALDVAPALYIKVHLEEQDMDFYWSKEKFQARRFKILELYGAWDVGGKSGLVEHLIDLSKEQGHYLIDPFIDDPSSTPVLIGHAQVTLTPIMHLTDLDMSYEILDLNDETLGSVRVQAIPCYSDELAGSDSMFNQQEGQELLSEPYRVYSQDDLKRRMLKNPRELLGKKLVFMLKIVSCHDIPDRYTHVHCQYSLQPDSCSVRTKVLREHDDGLAEEVDVHNSGGGDTLLFDHSHYICFERVTQEILDFFDYGFLTIQVVGYHKLSETANRSPTVISTIINSINKYKYKLEQQGLTYSGANYSPSAFYNSNSASNSDSARSQRGPPVPNSATSSVASTSNATFDQPNDEFDVGNSINGISQENVIDMILTKRKLERAENQLHYLERTINIAEHYNKKHIPLKTVKKLLNSYGQEMDSGSLEEMAADVTVKGKGGTNKNSACLIT